MKSLKLHLSLLTISRKEGRRPNAGFRLFSAAAGAATITDILEREYCDSFLPVPPQVDREKKASSIPESRKAFVEETMLAINDIVQQCSDGFTLTANTEVPHAQTPQEDVDSSMRSSYGVYRLLLDICNIKSWIERDTEMKRLQLVLRPTQVAWVLKVQKDSANAWDFFNWAARRTGYAHDQHCFAVMIDLLGSCAECSHLESLLLDMERVKVPLNVIILNRLIEIFASKGDAERSEHFFIKLKALEAHPNAVVYKCMVEVYAKANKCEEALEFLRVMQERRQFVSINCYNSLLGSLLRNGMVEAVWRVYGGMQECGMIADRSTYGILLCVLGHSGMAVKAMELWAEMVQQGMKPNRDAYNGILDALAGQNNLEMGTTFFKRMAEDGVDPDFLTCQLVTKLLCKTGQAGRALELALFIENKPVKMQVFESFIKSLGDAGCTQEVYLLVEGMKADGMVLSETTFLTMIDALCSTTAEQNEVMTAVEEMEKTCGKLSTESYNSILASLCHCDRFQFAYDFLKQCHGRGISPDAELSNTIFVELGKLQKLQLVEGIFDELNMMGSKIKVTTCNALLQSSAQVGDVETTKKVLRIMEANSVQPNVDTYNATMSCFSRAGQFNVALKVFNEMRMNGCLPDIISYNSVLRILRRAGLTDAVLSFLERMQEDGVKPDASTLSILSDVQENHAKPIREVEMTAVAVA